jgi:hypothetical protein
MPGFMVYRSDRNQFGRGVMLLINNNLHHDSFSLPPLSELEATAICLQLQNHSQLLFVSAYLPPAVAIAPTDFDAIFSVHDAIVLAGDLNCKHVSWNNLRYLLKLKNYYRHIPMVPPTFAPLHIPTFRPNLLDSPLTSL